MLYLNERWFGVYKVTKTRPEGIQCLVGKTFGEDGLIATGLFVGTSLKLAFEVENHASGFMGIQGKWNWYGFGETNEQRNLQGLGVNADSNSRTIRIGHWENGYHALGRYIEISYGGRDGRPSDIEVGDHYMKNEKRWWRCARYDHGGPT